MKDLEKAGKESSDKASLPVLQAPGISQPGATPYFRLLRVGLPLFLGGVLSPSGESVRGGELVREEEPVRGGH